MDFKHRFNVRRVSEVRNGLSGVVNEGMMPDVPENDVLQLDTTAAVGVGPPPVANKVPDEMNSTYPAGNYDGKVRRGSLAQLTREALPRLDYYRNCMQAMKRPSIGELHGEPIDPKQDLDTEAQKPEIEGASHGVKLGWIQGVLIPCLLNIWGVMLFLRLSWVVAQAGVGESLVIIAISAVVCVLTTLSLSAISTNGEVKGGGIYYIISRSLGPEFGASIGIVFAFANAVAASMNTIGFCDSLNDLLSKQGLKIVDGGVNDVRIVGTIAILVMCIICAVGMEWESKAQNVLVVIIVGAIVDFLAGAIVGPRSDDAISKGFTGFNMTVMTENWYPSYRYSEFTDQNFFTVFSIFFPSVTGIQAGANISGDLKDAAMAIPRGTLLALLISMFSYGVFVIFAGAASVRDASGIAEDVANWTQYDCALNNTCEWGLMNSYSMMQVISLWGPLIYAGCFAATLSTALTNLLSVPRLIQALGIDRIYPGLIFFSKGYGKAGEPYRGYVLTFLISVAFLLIAELNVIAPLISNFYLASYALINFCTFHAALVKPLGWRPTFKYYSMWLSLLGFLLCVCIMFLIDWITSLVTFCVVFALYLLVVYRKPDVNWGSSTQAQTYKTALTAAQRLVNVSEHVKNYRPQILVLTGRPGARPPLVDMAHLITKSSALMLCGEVHQERLSYRARQRKIRSSYTWLQANKVKAFYTMVDGIAFETGARALIQSTGIGKLRPNVLLMGYKRDWRTCNTADLSTYFNILHDAFENRLSVAILRMVDGLDYSRITEEAEAAANATINLTSMDSVNDIKPPQSTNALMRTDSNSSIANMHHNNGQHYLTFSGSQDETLTESPHSTRRYVLTEKTNMGSPLAILKNKKKAVAGQMLSNCSPSGKDISNMTFFKQKQPQGSTIDVWWLYDDGGLTILLPYIINLRHNWASCKLRVFALVNRRQEAELEERNMASLLSKFRIDYQSLTMVTGITEKPQPGTVTFFEELLNGFKEDETSDPDIRVTKVELASMQQKTDRQLRLRELLLQYSKSAALIFMDAFWYRYLEDYNVLKQLSALIGPVMQSLRTVSSTEKEEEE